MNRKTLVLPAVIGLLAPVLAACGGSDDGGRAGGAITVGTTDSYTASKEAPAPLDPAYAYDAGSWNLLRQTLQTLMTMPRGGGEPVLEAAKECGFTDSGNERYECTLRDGLKFASGDAITATDVKYSIDRVLGIKASTGVSGLLSTVDTIETQGYKKVIFHLRTPDATFPYKLATPVAGIVHPEEYPGTSSAPGSRSTAPAPTPCGPRSRATRSPRPCSPRTTATRASSPPRTTASNSVPSPTPTPWAPHSTRATSIS